MVAFWFLLSAVGTGFFVVINFIGNSHRQYYTPVLGLSTLLVSKLLNNPLGKVVAYEYSVTGSWDNPQVTRISAPLAKAAAATP